MKVKWLVLFILVLSVVQPFSVSAHTSLKNSNPAEGEVIKGDLSKIRLNFDTAIEKTSTVELKTAQGDVVLLEKPLIIGNEWSAVVQQKLESGTYLIRWKLISEDGHLVEGTIRFNVKAAVASSDATEDQDAEAAKVEPQQASIVPTESAETVEPGLFPTFLPWIVAVLVLAIVITFFLLRRQKRS